MRLGVVNSILALHLAAVSCLLHKIIHRHKYEVHPNWKLLPIDDCGLRAVFNSDVDHKMIEDDIAELGQHPWMAAIFVKTNDSVEFECGGSLINDRYILTAAHCVYRKHVYKVTLGEYNQSTYVDCNKEKTHCAPPRVNKEVDDVIIHPDYYTTKGQFFSRTDIALVRLKWPLDYFTDYIRPICLPTFATYQDFDGEDMEVAGWGMTSSGDDSDTLQSVRVPEVPYKKCFTLWNEAVLERQLCKAGDEEECQIDFEDNVICAGGIRGKGVSKGFSGGPLMTSIRVPGSGHVVFILGVVSFGVAKSHHLSVPPDVYTRVSRYLLWIMDTIQE